MLRHISSYIIFIFILTPLSFIAQNVIISGTVSDQYGPLPGAKITAEGHTTSAQTDINGKYSLELPQGKYILKASFITYITEKKELSTLFKDKVTVDYQLKSAADIDQQFSLGTRAKPRSLLETTAPVDIISPKDISNTNQIELSTILHYITPSFHSTPQTIADGTDHIDPATLRGLGPDQVLVLVNGKRRHSSSLLNVNGTLGRGTVGTDFNAIPVAAIDRIEILRDGATSQYGSDAIAGVINIILKKQTKDIVIDSRAQINTKGDGLTRYVGTNFGLNVGEKGFINVSAEYRNRNATNRAGNYTGTVYSDDITEDNALINANNFYNQTGYENQQVMQIGVAQTKNISLAVNSEVPISQNAKIYAYALRNYREGQSHGFYRFPKETNKVVESLFPNGFSPEINTDIQDDAISIGFNGTKNYWDIDFSHTIGTNRLDFTVSNSNNASLGIASPTSFSAGGYFYQQNNTNIDISRSFDYFEGLNVAFGGELRVENYKITSGEEASYFDGVNNEGTEDNKVAGAQVFPGIQPQNELNKFRTNSSGYIDIETKFNKRLLINTAARYETYSDFGGQGVWKIAGRYKFRNLVNFRIGLATGYRAPSLHQVFFNNISTQIQSDSEAVQVGTFNNQSALSKKLGVQQLKPELSRHFSAGFTSRLKNNLSFTFDYYFIRIKDRIVLSGTIDEDYLPDSEELNIGAAQFLTNAVDTKTSGADAVFVYETPFRNGNLNTSFALNISSTKVNSPVKVPAQLTNQESLFFSREEISRLETAQPDCKINSTISYEINKFNFNLSNTYFGSVEYKYADPDTGENILSLNTFNGEIESRDQVFSPKLITNLSVSYEILDNLTLALAGNNIFNKYPDKHTHSDNTSQGNFTYSRRVQQFGVLGANYSFKILLKL